MTAPGLLAPMLTPISQRIVDQRAAAVFQRDPAAVRRRLAAVTHLVNFFSPEVRGAEHVPVEGPALVVGNHSCLYLMPDAWLVGIELVRRRGVEHPAYALAYDLLFAVPGVGPFLRSIGAIPAGGSEAEAALAEGGVVLDYPGGDWEACRPWTKRNVVDLAGRLGFVRLALRSGAPVIPVVAHGSHQAVVVASRGERVAKVLGLRRLRIDVFPILLGPFGLAPLLAVPMPSQITVQFLEPLDWSGLGPEAADDPAVVARCHREVTSAMQGALDRLAVEQAHPVARGVANWLRGRPRRVEAPAV